MSGTRRKISVIALGGTIAMADGPGGLAPALDAAQLVAKLADEHTGPVIDWTDFAKVPSANISFADLVRLASTIERLHDEGYHGVVVSQGTDSLEETSFALELLVSRPIDIALTGAMRGSSAPGADGPANLLAALRFLEGSPGLGEVVVVLDDCVHAARHVAKSHTTALSAFSSGEAGLRGRIHEGSFVALNPPRAALPSIAMPPGAPPIHVELVSITIDHSPWIFRAADNAPVAGWIIAAMGAGHVPEALVPELARLSGKVPVVLCSRAARGAVCTATYGYPGAEIDLLRRGLIPAGNLSPLKARVLLTLLLMSGSDAWRDEFTRTASAV